MLLPWLPTTASNWLTQFIAKWRSICHGKWVLNEKEWKHLFFLISLEWKPLGDIWVGFSYFLLSVLFSLSLFLISIWQLQEKSEHWFSDGTFLWGTTLFHLGHWGTSHHLESVYFTLSRFWSACPQFYSCHPSSSEELPVVHGWNIIYAFQLSDNLKLILHNFSQCWTLFKVLDTISFSNFTAFL